MNDGLPESIFNIDNQESFSEAALGIFNLQSENNCVYRDFISSLGLKEIRNIDDIPFLPGDIFRSREVVTGTGAAEIVFESSTTSGSDPCRHFVKDLRLYEESYLRSFSRFYEDPADYFIAALLPSYTERKNSSLVYMVRGLINRSEYSDSGFYGNSYEELIEKIYRAKKNKRKTILIGVSFALLDLAEKYSPDLSGVIVMETGGMKGSPCERSMTSPSTRFASVSIKAISPASPVCSRA